MVPGTIAKLPGGITLDNSEARSAEKTFSVGAKIFKFYHILPYLKHVPIKIGPL